MQIRLSQSLVHPRLVGAERAAALQDQGDALEGRALGCDMGLPLCGPVTGHDEPRLWTGKARTTLPGQLGWDAPAEGIEVWVDGHAPCENGTRV